MTCQELSASVDAYFVTHLDAAFWAGLPAASKTAAVSMALGDVLAELPGMTLDKMVEESLSLKAVAEQAVYLARNYESMTEGKVVTGESVEGISNSYSLINANAGMGFRASAFIKRARSIITGCSVHIGRG